MKYCFSAILIMCFASMVFAADVNLAWDASTEPVSGYRIYGARHNDAHDFSAPVYDGAATTCTVVIPNAAEYKFIARAYIVGDSGAIYESGDSNQVQHAVVVWTNPNLRVQ